MEQGKVFVNGSLLKHVSDVMQDTEDEGDFVLVTRRQAHTTKREENSKNVKRQVLAHVGDERLNRQIRSEHYRKKPQQSRKAAQQAHFN